MNLSVKNIPNRKKLLLMNIIWYHLSFFHQKGINYLMPKIIDSISNGIRNDNIQ